MAEPEKYVFTYREVAEALVKQQDIHEGVWSIYVEFGLAGANTGPSDDQLLPTAIVPIVRMGLVRVPKENALSVDATVVNPAGATAST